MSQVICPAKLFRPDHDMSAPVLLIASLIMVVTERSLFSITHDHNRLR